VNLAARLEQVADPGGVIVSGNVYDEVRGKLPFTFHDRGSQRFKNIAQPTRTFAVSIATRPPSQDMLPRKGQRPVVTVRPFVDKSGDASQQYFADGLSEDIVAALLRLSSIAVWQHHAGKQHARPPGEFFPSKAVCEGQAV
jgi:adenylate cyclase